MPGARPPAARAGAWIFVAFAALYLATSHGRPFSDSLYYFEQIDTFVTTGAFTMAPERAADSQGSVTFFRRGRDGRVYLTLPPGLALAASPLGWLGARLREDGTGHVPRAGRPDPTITLWASFTMPLAVAAMVLCFFAISHEATGCVRRAAEGALVLGLATNTWFYATTFWTRPLATACLVGALLAIVRARERVACFALAGALMGFAVVTRYEFVLVLPWLLGLALVQTRRPLSALAALLLPLGLCAAGLLLWNDVRFGSLLETGARHQTTRDFSVRFARQAVVRLLVGSNEGLFRYVPILLLGLVGIPAALRAERRLTVTALGVATTLLAFYAVFQWSRSVPPIAWGSRHLFPLVPFLLLPAFLARDHDPLAPTWAKLLVAVSLGLQLLGVLQRKSVAAPVWWLAEPSPRSLATAAALAGTTAFALFMAFRAIATSTLPATAIPAPAIRDSPSP